MLKLFITLIIAISLFIPSAFAQTWHTANQATLAWDAVVTLDNGTPIPAGSTVKYQPYIKTSPTDPGSTYGTEVTTLAQLYTFSVEGSYFLGVKAIRYVGTEKVSESVVSWSSDPLVCEDNEAFGVKYYRPLAKPIGLRQGG